MSILFRFFSGVCIDESLVFISKSLFKTIFTLELTLIYVGWGGVLSPPALGFHLIT